MYKVEMATRMARGTDLDSIAYIIFGLERKIVFHFMFITIMESDRKLRKRMVNIIRCESVR